MNGFDRRGWYLFAILTACVAAPVSLVAWAAYALQINS